MNLYFLVEGRRSESKVYPKWLEYLLPERVVYPRQPDGDTFREYAKFYNVSVDDPESMGLYKGFKSISLFHYSYLKEMLAERNVRYTKYNPKGVIEVPYIEQLIARVKDTNHLRSLKDFFDFCHAIGEKIIKRKT